MQYSTPPPSSSLSSSSSSSSSSGSCHELHSTMLLHLQRPFVVINSSISVPFLADANQILPFTFSCSLVCVPSVFRQGHILQRPPHLSLYARKIQSVCLISHWLVVSLYPLVQRLPGLLHVMSLIR